MMISGITRLALSLGLNLSLGVAFMPLGCGGKQKAVDYATADGPPEVPDGIKEELTACVERGVGRLSDSHYAIMFDVRADDDGDVRSVEIHDSILPDRAMESCMRRALQGMTVPSSIRAMRSSRSDGEGVVAPGSRALVGNPLVLGGATVALGPVVIVAAGVTVLVAVTIYLVSEMSKPSDMADEEYERCHKVKDACQRECAHLMGVKKWHGDRYHKCVRECLEAENCWGVINP
jgi:hypothetical protein